MKEKKKRIANIIVLNSNVGSMHNNKDERKKKRKRNLVSYMEEE